MGEKITLTILTGIFKGIALLPLSVLYVISDFLYIITYYVARYRRKVVRKNLLKSFPEKSENEIKSVERKFYRHFTDYVVETIKILHISDEEMRKRMVFKNIEELESVRGDGKPIFLYVGHYGNWEFIPSITLWLKEGLEPCQVYHPLKNKVMDKFFLKLRSRFHSVSMSQQQTLRVILTMLRSGKQPILGLIADQHPKKKMSKVWMRFMNQETALITGGETMGRRIGAHFFYSQFKCPKRGYYEMTFIRINPDESDEFSVTKQYMRMLEQDIKAEPQYWLWSHNRWKYKYSDINPGETMPE